MGKHAKPYFGGVIGVDPLVSSTPRNSGVFSLGALGGDGAAATRPTRRWGGMTGRSLVASAAASGDANWSDVVLLLDGSGADASTTFTDASPAQTTILVDSNAQVDQGEKRHGTGSIQFAGTLDALRFDDIGLGTGDFTIELWLKTTSTLTYATLFSNVINFNGQGFSWLINNGSGDGSMAVWGDDDAIGGSPQLVGATTSAVNDGTWHHLAFVRSGTSVELFKDGSSVGTDTLTAGHSFDGDSSGNTDFYIGRDRQFTGRDLVGHMDDIRITKGVARDIAADWAAGVYNSALPQGAYVAASTNVPTTGVLSLAEHYQGTL